jgi:uncharacterized membrane protein
MSPQLIAVAQLFLRYLHVLFGILWLGQLFFLTLVNAPFQRDLHPDLAPRVNPLLLRRAFWWFRWSAMATFVFGWVLFFLTYWPLQQHLAQGRVSPQLVWMLLGALLGSLMWWNVFMFVWPAWREILDGLAGGTAAVPSGLVRRASLFSRVNLFLAGPMLVCMIAASHQVAWAQMPGWSHGLFVLGSVALIGHLLQLSRKVGQGS